MAVSDVEVVGILDLLGAVGADPRVVGGWGVDALAERQTRVHRDLDVVVRADRVDACVAALTAAGYGVTADRRPRRVELDDGLRRVDVRPLTVADDRAAGHRLDGGHDDVDADAWVSGLIAGRSVVCASVAVQRRSRDRDHPRRAEAHDLALLDAMADEPGADSAAAAERGERGHH